MILYFPQKKHKLTIIHSAQLGFGSTLAFVLPFPPHTTRTGPPQQNLVFFLFRFSCATAYPHKPQFECGKVRPTSTTTHTRAREFPPSYQKERPSWWWRKSRHFFFTACFALPPPPGLFICSSPLGKRGEFGGTTTHLLGSLFFLCRKNIFDVEGCGGGDDTDSDSEDCKLAFARIHCSIEVHSRPIPRHELPLPLLLLDCIQYYPSFTILLEFSLTLVPPPSDS